MKSRLVVVVALLLGVWVSGFGCRKDVGVQRYAQAEARYSELVQAGIGPRDPRFDEVRALLRDVPPESEAHELAQGLLKKLEAFRAVPERPLVVPGRESSSRCEPLAQALGIAKGEARERILEELRACRLEEEKRKAHDHPEGEHGHDH